MFGNQKHIWVSSWFSVLAVVFTTLHLEWSFSSPSMKPSSVLSLRRDILSDFIQVTKRPAIQLLPSCEYLNSQQHLGVALPTKSPLGEEGDSGSRRQKVLMVGYALRWALCGVGCRFDSPNHSKSTLEGTPSPGYPHILLCADPDRG